MQNCIQKCNIRLEKSEIYIEVFNIVLKTLWNIKNRIPPKLSIQFRHIHNLLYNLETPNICTCTTKYDTYRIFDRICTRVCNFAIDELIVK